MSFATTHIVPEDLNDSPFHQNGHTTVASKAGDVEAGVLKQEKGLARWMTSHWQQPTLLPREQHGPPTGQPCRHKQYSPCTRFMRHVMVSANDGLTSIASVMVGVGAVNKGAKEMIAAGLVGIVAGTSSVGISKYPSNFSQRDSEKADVEKEQQEHPKGSAAQAQELKELTQTYIGKELPCMVAEQVAKQLMRVDMIKAYIQDELGIDVDEYTRPLTSMVASAVASATAFACGGAIPLVAGSFIKSYEHRLLSVILTTSGVLIVFGAIGAMLDGAPKLRAALRVWLGGFMAMLLTVGVLQLCRIAKAFP